MYAVLFGYEVLNAFVITVNHIIFIFIFKQNHKRKK